LGADTLKEDQSNFLADLLNNVIQKMIQDKDKKTPEIITYRDQPVKRIKKAFYAAKKRAGITRRLRIYDFRHSFATTVLGEEGDLKSASEIMGHSRTETTMQIYQHTNTKLHRRTINKFPELNLPD
jgi:integrase